MPPVVQRGGGGSIAAGPFTGPRRLTPAVLRPPSEEAQPVHLIVSSNTGYSVPLVTRYQVPGLAPSSAERRFSEIDTLGAQHAQVDFLHLHALENQPIPDAYASHPWSSSPPAIPTAQYPAAVPADMAQWRSVYTHRDFAASVYSEDSLQLPSSSALQVDLDSNATFSPRHVSPNTPSHFADHTLPQQGSSLAVAEALRKKRRAGQRKRFGNPKDQKAAQRLQNQRESDDEHIEYLYKLFVPDSEGKVPKKDRLRLSTPQSLCLSS